jgi:alpha-D-ribose 1-methylphosphonate 5-triphosphate synthase subunit PhnH
MMITHLPVYSQAEATQHATFAALMGSLSTPGRIYDLPNGDALDLIADALLDLETSWYTQNHKLGERLTQTGARALTADTAAYHFYTGAIDLHAVAQAHIGTMLYPDSAATLIITCDFHLGEPPTQVWTGPGIKGAHHSSLGMSSEFWTLRERNTYPLGWDVIFTDGRRVMGLPRTTRITPIRYEE